MDVNKDEFFPLPLNTGTKRSGSNLDAGSGRGRFPAGLVLLLAGLTIAFALAAGCTRPLPAPGLSADRPETKIIDLRPAIVRKALLRVLNDRKFSVDPKRTSLQRVETEWLQDGSFRSRITAGIKPLDDFHTELAVKILLEKKTFWGESWEPYDRIDPRAHSEFIDAVRLESYRILYDGR